MRPPRHAERPSRPARVRTGWGRPNLPNPPPHPPGAPVPRASASLNFDIGATRQVGEGQNNETTTTGGASASAGAMAPGPSPSRPRAGGPGRGARGQRAAAAAAAAAAAVLRAEAGTQRGGLLPGRAAAQGFSGWGRRAEAVGGWGGRAAPSGRGVRVGRATGAGSGGAGGTPQDAVVRGRGAGGAGTGTFLLVLANVAVFALGTLGLLDTGALALNQMRPTWSQYVTSLFCHYNWGHLSSNLFQLYVFGKIVEEEEGIVGVLLSYLITGVCANIASVLLLPSNVVSMGASGAVFGLFAVGVLAKLRFDLRKLMEGAIIGNFVYTQLKAEVQSQAGQGAALVGGVAVNHVAHLAGALSGVLLMILLSSLARAGEQDHVGEV